VVAVIDVAVVNRHHYPAFVPDTATDKTLLEVLITPTFETLEQAQLVIAVEAVKAFKAVKTVVIPPIIMPIDY
jgi:hypothetical protein